MKKVTLNFTIENVFKIKDDATDEEIQEAFSTFVENLDSLLLNGTVTQSQLTIE